MNSKESPKDLWLSFINGDEKAFTLLYKDIYPDLYSYGIKIGMNSQQVRDTIQDVFVKLYTNTCLVKDPQGIRALLFRSIKNEYLNILKRENIFNRIKSEEEAVTTFDITYSIDERLIKEEEYSALKQKVETILDILTPRQREIIYLRFLEEMNYKEIALIMNISEQVARNLLYKSIKRIRETNLQGYYALLFLIESRLTTLFPPF